MKKSVLYKLDCGHSFSRDNSKGNYYVEQQVFCNHCSTFPEIIEIKLIKDSNDESPKSQIEITWTFQDVQNVREDLSEEQAKNVLALVVKKHNAEIGVNWAFIGSVADSLYPQTFTCDNCGNFDLYKEETEGCGGCDAKHGTVHQDNNANDCPDFYHVI